MSSMTIPQIAQSMRDSGEIKPDWMRRRDLKGKTKRWIYVLELLNGDYYIGETKFIKNRISKHYRGGSVATKTHGVKRLVTKHEYNCTEDEIKQVEAKISLDLNQAGFTTHGVHSHV